VEEYYSDKDYQRNLVNRDEYFADGRYERRRDNDGILPVYVEKKKREKPYSKKQDSYQSIIKENSKKAGTSTPMEEEILITPEIESSKERKLRRSKKHDVDFYDLIKNLPVTMTLEETIKTFPPAQQQLRASIANLGPGYTMVENGVQSIEEEQS